MPVNISSPMNGLAAIKKLGIPQPDYDWLVTSPYKVNLKADGFHFLGPNDQGGMIEVGAVPASLDTIQMLHKGNVPLGAKALLVNAILKIVMTLQLLPIPEVNKGGVLGMLPKSAVEKGLGSTTSKEEGSIFAAEAIAASHGWPTMNIADIESAVKVKLEDATMLYQPVYGSNKNSRYFVVGATEDLRIAARWKPLSGLSIRIEGKGYNKHKPRLDEVGLDTGATHASIHMKVKDQMMANKVLGAIMLGLGMPIVTQFPDLSLIAGKGI